MKFVRDQAELPQPKQEERQRLAKANVIARASQMSKISDALEGK